ncbi:hypothetical protein, partial [Salmonella enterica]|uniref:hypothetical protein n=1 Tax=Salmonella enterica TaxID=28901 RepID=UPI003EDBE66A
ARYPARAALPSPVQQTIAGIAVPNRLRLASGFLADYLFCFRQGNFAREKFGEKGIAEIFKFSRF